MRLVVLSYCNSLSAHVIGSIHQRHPIAAVVKVVWQPPAGRASAWSRMWSSPVATLQQALNKRVENWQHGRRMNRVNKLLSGEAGAIPDVPIFTIGSRQLHTSASLEMFASLSPDVLLVSHAPLLKPALFEQPSIATLNIHWGISPHYCGEHTLFWPLYYRDYEHVGVTIHRIDAGIDTGPILAQGFPALAPADDEAAVLARCAPWRANWQARFSMRRRPAIR